MFPLENEYNPLLPRNAHGTYKAACTTVSMLRNNVYVMYYKFIKKIPAKIIDISHIYENNFHIHDDIGFKVTIIYWWY